MFMRIVIIFCLSYSCVFGQQASKTHDQFLVYFFLLEDCRICQSYVATINTLSQKYSSDSIRFKAYYSSPSSSIASVEAFYTKYKLQVPYIIDSLQSTARYFKIEVMPECIIYNLSKDKVLYKGRIDDWFVKIGKRRNKPNTRDLESALIAISKHQKIDVTRTTPVGCFLTYID